jgi:hypothetical protein
MATVVKVACGPKRLFQTQLSEVPEFVFQKCRIFNARLGC